MSLSKTGLILAGIAAPLMVIESIVAYNVMTGYTGVVRLPSAMRLLLTFAITALVAYGVGYASDNLVALVDQRWVDYKTRKATDPDVLALTPGAQVRTN